MVFPWYLHTEQNKKNLDKNLTKKLGTAASVEPAFYISALPGDFNENF